MNPGVCQKMALKSPQPPFAKGGRGGISIHSRSPRPQAGHGEFRRKDAMGRMVTLSPSCGEIKYFRQLFFLLPLLLFSFGLSSCTVRYIPPKTAEGISQEIARSEKQISNPEDAAARAEGHLRLAWLYLDHRNPRADYGRALKEFETYARLAPEKAEDEEIQEWLSVLRAFEALKKENALLQEQILAATKEKGEGKGLLDQQSATNKKLKADNQKLRENNKHLQETIKKLKNLDRQIEERRKSIQ